MGKRVLRRVKPTLRLVHKIAYLKLLALGVRAIDSDGEWGAIVMIETVTHRCQVPSQASKHLVYIDYIKTAPWNWRPWVLKGARKESGFVTLQKVVCY